MILSSGIGFVNKTVQNILIVNGAETPLQKAGIRIPRRQASIQPYYLIIFHLSLALFDLYIPSSNFEQQPVLFMLIHGFGIARASCRLVIHSMTREAMPAVDASLLAPLLAASTTFLVSPDSEQTLLTLYGICAALAIGDHAMYCTLAIRDICEGRNINTFSLKSGKPLVIDEGFYIAGTSPTGVPDAVKRWSVWKDNSKNKEAFNALYGVK
jgi:hypothetical protein